MAGLDGLGPENLRNVIQIKNAVNDVKSAIAATNKEFKKMDLTIPKISKDLGDVVKAANKFDALQQEAAKSSKATSKAISEQVKQQGIVRSLNIQINELMSKARKANDKQAKQLIAQAQQIGAVRDGAKDLADEFGKIAESSAKMDKSTMWFTGFSDFVKDVPGLRMLSGPFEAAAKASRETVMNNAKSKDIQSRIGSLLKEEAKGEMVKDKKGIKRKKLDLKTGRGLTKAKLKEMKLDDITKGKTGKQAASMLKAAKKTNVVQGVGRSGMAAGMKALGPMITKAFAPIAIITTIAAGIKALIKAMLGASAETAKFSNNLLISRESARDLRGEVTRTVAMFNAQNHELGDQNIAREDMMKQMDAINSKLGFQADLLRDFGTDMGKNVAESALLVKNFGFSAEASAALFLESVKLGKPLKEHTKEMMGQLGFLSAQDGLTVDITKTIERATKISGNLKANFNDSIGAIAAAVYQSDRLGLNLESMEGVSSNLLDFQSSIENEMKAELLLGKSLNLDKAREFALMGDTENLMKEISKQAGTQKDFLKMNIVQRKALAGAVGLEVNELADMFSKQKKMDALVAKNLKIKNKLKAAGIKLDLDEFGNTTQSLQEIIVATKLVGKQEADIREILGDQIYLRKQEESAQQKFNDALTQAKDIFASLVTGGTLDRLVAALEGFVNSSLMKQFLEPVNQENAQKNTDTILANNKNLTEENIAQIKKVNETAQEQIPGFFSKMLDRVVGTVLFGPSGAIVADAKNYFTEKNITESRDQIAAGVDNVDAIIDPSKVKTEDDFILRPGQDAISFNKGDILMGGTNLEGGGNVEAMLGRILAAIENGGDVYMDGNKVGKSLALSTSRMG